MICRGGINTLCGKRLGSQRGFTILELVMAVSMSMLAVAVIFAAWRYFSVHTISNQRTSTFNVEVDRLAKSLAGRVRRSPEILAWNESGIAFIDRHTNDTVALAFYNDSLYFAEKTVKLASHGAGIVKFEIEKVSEDKLLETANLLLKFALGVEDGYSNTSEISVNVMVLNPGDALNSRDDLAWDTEWWYDLADSYYY
ncbi:MAG: hypothetical protein GF398_04655 [Chitinivibrionales bacterium]|nr:hypothetical protein [Chitinivibrionales bacterium]